MHEEKANKHANEDTVPKGAVPAYLLDREGVSRAKVCKLVTDVCSTNRWADCCLCVCACLH